MVYLHLAASLTPNTPHELRFNTDTNLSVEPLISGSHFGQVHHDVRDLRNAPANNLIQIRSNPSFDFSTAFSCVE